MRSQYDRITIRFDRTVGRKVRALAKRRGLSMAEYCRMMCSLEILNDDPDLPIDVHQQLKEVLADTERFGQADPQSQVNVLRRTLDTITALRAAADEATTWLTALTRASYAYTRARQTGGRPDARSSDEGDPDPPSSR
jgi:hypothetical protein